jgi:hypothetical protein
VSITGCRYIGQKWLERTRVILQRELELRVKSALIIQDAVRSRILARHRIAHLRYLALEAKRQEHLQSKHDADQKYLKVRIHNPLSHILGNRKDPRGGGVEFEIPVLAKTANRVVFNLKKTLNPLQRQKEENAARRLQSAYKRKQFHARLKERIADSLRIKREGKRRRELQHCLKVQTAFRKFAAQKTVREMKEDVASSKIASVARGIQSRNQTKRLFVVTHNPNRQPITHNPYLTYNP